MRYLKSFLSHSATQERASISDPPEETAKREKADFERAKSVDRRNREIYRDNQKLVAAAKQTIKESGVSVPGLEGFTAPAIPVEYARKYQELMDKEKEAEAAYLERLEREAEQQTG